jgi:hypothetical protein
MSTLNAVASTFKPNIIAITETCFNYTSCTTLHGYNFFNKNRATNAGGVAIYVEEGIESFELTNIDLCTDEVEQIWCALRIRTEKILLGCIYRPPPKSGEDHATRLGLESALLRSLSSAAGLVEQGEFDILCICGDFNFSKVSWDSDSIPSTPIRSASSPEALFMNTVITTFCTNVSLSRVFTMLTVCV